MPEAPPPGVYPLYLRESTAEKYGFKKGEGSQNYHPYLLLKRDDVMKEIQTMGKMSDFDVAKKLIEGFKGENLLFVVDKSQKYGELILLCHTEESQEEYMKSIREQQEALAEQALAEQQAEIQRKAAEIERLNVEFKDVPLRTKQWVSSTTHETDAELRLLSYQASREPIGIEITRPKKYLRGNYRFSDRNAETVGVAEFRAYKDPNFKSIRETDQGIQVAPLNADTSVQTTWYRSVNKAVQYAAAGGLVEPTEGEAKEDLLAFLEKSVVKIENALQQNETVDIYHETFRMAGEDENLEGAMVENELREIKNFADPNYSKSKALCFIDWMPKSQGGVLAASGVRNISFDQRVLSAGQTQTSFILVWDFRQLVKPIVMMQCQHEVFTFRFNRTNPNLVAGGCITGQVVLWDISDAMIANTKKNNRGGSAQETEEEDASSLPISPKLMSSVDFSHRKCVADIFWLPPTTQINHKGQLVANEHLDGNCYQFITIAGDGLVMVWDIRFEQIYFDELKHIGRAKHVPTEKASNKDQHSYFKPLWTPIFKAHLKKLEGVGELSLCKVSGTGALRAAVAEASVLPGDHRSHLMLTTEEGDMIFADICLRREYHATAKEEEEEEVETTGREFVRWIARDHPRPTVGLQRSPFFPDIVLSVGDWNFHIWKVGEEQPQFVSAYSNTYLTAGAWSPTRPAVVIVACADGNLHAWDFSDSSVRPSIELKATHARITSMEFLASHSVASSRQQLLAVGDETGTLHVFEMPRNLIRPVHKEEAIMSQFLDREQQKIQYMHDTSAGESADAHHTDTRPGTSDLSIMMTTDDAAIKQSDDLMHEEMLKAERDALKKEEDEFAKLESLFITELGLKATDLPTFLKNLPPPAPSGK